MRQLSIRSLWASGTIGASPTLRLTVTTPAELAEVLTILDPFHAAVRSIGPVQ